MSDPLQHRGVEKAVERSTLKFAKLLSPKMKSVYWPYFGFPTNEQDRIITKQNVVCTLCHKVLTNHGNTTNLRAHLQHRHKDIFNKVCEENGIKIPPRRPIVKATHRKESAQTKIKLEYEATQDSSAASMGGEEQAMLYESMVPITYDDDEIIDSINFAKVEVTGANGGGVSRKVGDGEVSNEVEVICTKLSKANAPNYRVEMMDDIDPFQIQDSLVNLLVQDLRNVNTLYDNGMLQFLRSFSSSIVIPSNRKIESLIKELHSDKLTTLGDQFKVHSFAKPYSLGFELWSNVEQKSFISMYFNHTTESPEYNLLNQLYCTFEYNKFTSLDSLFEEFSLQNCTVAIVNYDYNDYLKHFLQEKNIPIVLSYEVIVDKCLKQTYALPAVAAVIEELKDVIMRYATEINSKEVEIPIVNNDFPWTIFELLKFFAETVSWPDDLDGLVTTAKTITDTLNFLAITLDTLKSEDIPHSSMLSPITSKILNKKLAVAPGDDDMIASIKCAITAELQKHVISDDHLTLSALLDPRFHRLTNVNNIGACLQILINKHNKLCELEGYVHPSAKEVAPKKEVLNANKKSNLELFFDIQEFQEVEPMQEESNIETDLKRYRSEVHVSLDESPFLWWNKVGHTYGALKRLASQYQCVPCVVNMNFKKPMKQQIYEHQKRFMLSGNLVDPILFLHCNGKSV